MQRGNEAIWRFRPAVLPSTLLCCVRGRQDANGYEKRRCAQVWAKTCCGTGRFGVGFNSVYHLTDVPSFVSGRHVVYFDPHAHFLPGATASNPGLKIRFAGSGYLDQFPDQFAPYLHFGCDMNAPFAGTLFRFPLRTQEQADRYGQHGLRPGQVYTPEMVPQTRAFARLSDKLKRRYREGG